MNDHDYQDMDAEDELVVTGYPLLWWACVIVAGAACLVNVFFTR